MVWSSSLQGVPAQLQTKANAAQTTNSSTEEQEVVLVLRSTPATLETDLKERGKKHFELTKLNIRKLKISGYRTINEICNTRQ